jgi:hypothetical protein
MGIKFSPLPVAPSSYSQEGESIFRRSVENSMLSAYSEINNAVGADEGSASLASKRELMLTKSPNGPRVERRSQSMASIQGLESLFFITVNSYIDDYILEFPGTANIYGILGGYPGQRITLWFNSPGFTVTILDAPFSLIKLNGAANFVVSASTGTGSTQGISNLTNITLQKPFSGSSSSAYAALSQPSWWVEVSRMTR